MNKINKKLTKIIDPIWHIVPKLKINNSSVMTSEQHGNFSRDQIKEYVQSISDDLADDGKQGEISVSFYYHDAHWRIGYQSRFGENVDLFEVYEDNAQIHDDFITGFKIFIIKDNPIPIVPVVVVPKIIKKNVKKITK